jgi:hypothetical protein
VLRNVVLYAQNPVHGGPLCAGSNGRFFEERFIDGKLAVIVDSPRMFLPRATYGAHGQAYRFPLDWDVVLKYPDRARGNAVDFHLMERLKGWKPLPQIETTADILTNYQQFLVIAQPYRAWFHNLNATHQVTAEKIAEVIPTANDDVPCTLWKVTRVEPRK